MEVELPFAIERALKGLDGIVNGPCPDLTVRRGVVERILVNGGARLPTHLTKDLRAVGFVEEVDYALVWHRRPPLSHRR